MIGEAALHAFLDNELDTQANQQVEQWLQQNPEHFQELQTWQQQKLELKEAFDPVLKERIPKDIQKALNKSPVRRPTTTWRSMAASLMLLALGGASGWYLKEYQPQIMEIARKQNAPKDNMLAKNGNQDKNKRLAKNDAMSKSGKKWPKFAFSAISSHVVFSQDLTRPVEFAEPQKNYLLAWIKHRTGKKLTPPDLSSSGFKLLGGRVLPFEEKPAALFMYENVSGERITLFIGQNKQPETKRKKFWSKNGVNCFFWLKGDLNFALTGSEGEDKLDKMSQKVISHFQNI